MATGDMVARLLLDSRAFDSSMKKAREGSKVLGKDLSSSFERATRGVTALSTAVVAALEIYKTVKEWSAAIKKSEDSLKSVDAKFDELGKKIGIGLDEIKQKANSGIFTGLANGIDIAISRAEQLSRVIDDIEAEKLALAFGAAVEGGEFKAVATQAKNTDLSMNERRALAYELEDLNEYTKIAADEKQAALIEQAARLITKYSGVHTPEDLDILKKIMTTKKSSADVKTAKDRARWLAAQMLEYDRKHFPKAFDKYGTPKTSDIRERIKMQGYSASRVDGTLSARRSHMKSLAADYESELAMNAVWNVMPQAEREKLSTLLTAAIEAYSEYNAQNAEIKAIYKGFESEIGKKAAEREKKKRDARIYADMLLNYPWDTQAVREMTFNAAAPGKLTAANIASFSVLPGLRGAMDLRLPEIPKYEGMYNSWQFGKNAPKSSGALAAMGESAFDWDGLQQSIADDKLAEWASKNREEFDAWGTSINLLGGAFKTLGDSIGGTTGELFTFIGGLIDAAQQMLPFIAQIMAETAARQANATAATTEAAAKTMSTYAGIPFAGIGLGLAAVAAVVSAIQSVPKFAEGGIVTSATLGVFGEAGPEAVMPLDRLEEFVTGRDVRVTGNIKASGKELVVVLDNYNRVRNG